MAPAMMKVLVVARTRQGSAACVGGISFEGRSVRLVSPDPADDRAGLEYHVGDVWEIQFEPPPTLLPPHVENVVVRAHRRLGRMTDPAAFIERHMPPARGGVEVLYGGLVQASPAGGMYISERTGIPTHSTMFWRPDRALRRDDSAKRIHYTYLATYLTDDRPWRLVFVGFQEPVEEIAAGTLLRVSLAHWWRPADRPDETPRCFVQLSGWIDDCMNPHSASVPAAVDPSPAGQVRSQAPPPTAPTLAAAREMLSRVFGYDTFRPLQEEVIGSVLNGRSVLAVMPTGSGKSLCYQLPALLLRGLTVVVSPLISLMQDQVDQLRELGVRAAFLNSTLSHAQYVAVARSIRAGEVRLLYLAPETLLRPEVLVLLDQSSVACLVVDEAHCISEWGHDFRPDYRQLHAVRLRYPDAVCLAVTATAAHRVQEDIRAQLGIAPKDTYLAGFDRPNLFLEVCRRGSGWDQVLKFVSDRREQSGIVYCSTRAQVESLVAELGRRGFSALPYHAGLEDPVRRENQRAFSRDETPLVVATIAFGLGINKPNVRYIIHAALPGCLETYYQQVGRAGRDGLRSECLLLFARADVGTHYHFIRAGAGDEAPGRLARLQAMVRYAEATRCRRALLLPYFDDPPPESPCGMCDNCLANSPPCARGRESIDATNDARVFLGGVRLTGQRFGMAYVTEMLRGARTQGVLRRGHDRLASYGSGKHRSVEAWRRLASQLLEQGLLEQEMEFGTLRITAAGEQVLAGAPVFVAGEEPPRGARQETGEKHDPILFEALRQLRRRLADEASVPPFVVFSDRTLVELATHYPTTPKAFREVHGVGDRKAETYAAPFLAAIREHLEVHGAEVSGRGVAPVLGSGRRFEEVGLLFRDGRSVAELSECFGVKEATIIHSIHEFVRAGGAVDPRRVLAECALTEPERERVLATMASVGGTQLGPVHAALEGAVPYRELHLLRLYRLAGGG